MQVVGVEVDYIKVASLFQHLIHHYQVVRQVIHAVLIQT